MSEILKKRFSESIGKEAKVFLHNGFRYAGKITGCDDKYVELLDTKTNSYKIIDLIDIKDCDIANDGGLK